MRSLLSMLLLLVAGDAMAVDVQYGLRLDAESSLQWRGATLYAEGSKPGLLKTSRGGILGIWTGPVPGTLAVHVEEGLGILIGDDIHPMAAVPTGSIVRTSRRDVVWVGRTEHTTAGPRIRIFEMKGTAVGRLAVDSPGELLDFDVSASGRIVYLTTDGRVYLAGGGATKEIARPRVEASSNAIRVFVARDEKEVSLLFPEALCSAAAERREWRCDPFRAAEAAVVRQAWDGRVTLEPRSGR